ncbi:BTAD domain-containing putative transcriptional regulator (plasmid) [Streptomyces sp. CG1]|uniref:AfsR/SARP family transcriptional regulator n=1 Tax=Streptomyces sp. CG1 TaxID=1287523 RepID=UPI0034E2673B
MQFRLLGNLEVTVGQDGSLLLAPKLRTILALLLISRGRTVPLSRFIDELWQDRPPATVNATMQTYIYQLRKALGSDEGQDGAVALLTESAGYALRTPADHVDVHVFENRLAAGRAALDAGDCETASRSFDEALAEWRSAVLADVPKGPFLESYAVRLEEARMQATELRIEAYLRLGRHPEVLPELKAHIVEHPLHEGFHCRLMLALHRCGRRYEALEVYARLRTALAAELGLEPSPSVQHLHRALLSGDPALDRTRRHPLAVPDLVTVPAQLPPDIADFHGRSAELERLERLCGRQSGQTAPRVLALTGMAGAGKTALAVRLAHRVRHRFPDGQFHACFAASEPGSASAPGAHSALGSFLHGIGFTPEQVPTDLVGRAQLFRSWCADRAVLVLLDDVASADQVRTLLPGGPGCAVLVTSRRPLYGLGGARGMELELLPPEDAVELLAQVACRRWAARELQTAHTVAGLCEHLPLALRAVGSELALSSRISLDGALRRLADPDGRLDALETGGDGPGTRLWSSYARLDEPTKQALHQLCEVEGPEAGSTVFTAEGAAGLLGLPPLAAEAALVRLHDERFLLASRPSGPHEVRYRLLDLVRLFVHRAAPSAVRPSFTTR